MNSQQKFILRQERRAMKRRQRMIRASHRRVREALTDLAHQFDYLADRMERASQATIELSGAIDEYQDRQ
jgi:hypothetical protein